MKVQCERVACPHVRRAIFRVPSSEPLRAPSTPSADAPDPGGRLLPGADRLHRPHGHDHQLPGQLRRRPGDTGHDRHRLPPGQDPRLLRLLRPHHPGRARGHHDQGRSSHRRRRPRLPGEHQRGQGPPGLAGRAEHHRHARRRRLQGDDPAPRPRSLSGLERSRRRNGRRTGGVRRPVRRPGRAPVGQHVLQGRRRHQGLGHLPRCGDAVRRGEGLRHHGHLGRPRHGGQGRQRLGLRPGLPGCVLVDPIRHLADQRPGAARGHSDGSRPAAASRSAHPCVRTGPCTADPAVAPVPQCSRFRLDA